VRPPPHAYFAVSAVFHYLGPAFAALLFARVDVLGVAWLRIVVAALVFAAWRRPWRAVRGLGAGGRRLLLAWAVCLALMNCCFYLAIDRLPLATVAAIEFLPVIALAALGARTARNVAALVLAVAGVWALTGVHLAGGAPSLALAFANAALFAAYIVLADRVAKRPQLDGLDGLGAAMLGAAIVVTPPAGWAAAPALLDPAAVLAGAGVGVSSSVIPYVCDQLALTRLPRATYSLMVSLLPATATLIGIIVLAQIPSLRDLAGVALVVTGVALHRSAAAPGAGAQEGQPPVVNRMHSRAPLAEPAESSTASATEAIVGSPRPRPGESARGSGPNPSSSTTMQR
jgi:inner membrane transporter RhtA